MLRWNRALTSNIVAGNSSFLFPCVKTVIYKLELTQRIQQETMMNLLESHCFLTDEINYRLATDCAQGTFPAEYCP